MTHALQLEGQVALVTGAGRGFGKAIAMRLAQEGAKVGVTARTQKELDAVAAEIQRAGGEALAVVGDIANANDVARIVELTQERFGVMTLLVSNAGAPGPFGPIWEVDPEAWWRSQEVHIRAPIMLLRNVLPDMLLRGVGRVIVISAVASRVVAPYLSAYSVGKLAQKRIVEEVAAEVKGSGVSAFAIDPGFVVTGLAEETMRSPHAQRWLPDMVARLRERAQQPNADGDLARCAQRCVDLASGRYDALSGSYLELKDDLEQLLRASATAAS